MNKQWRCYKANKTNSGAASCIDTRVVEKTKNDYTTKELLVFWTGALQNGKDKNNNAVFAWPSKSDNTNINKSVIFKLGQTDLGEIIAVLNGIKNEVGLATGNFKGSLFHKNENGNTTLGFTKAKDLGYYVRLAKKTNTSSQLIEVKHTLSFSEGEILRVLLEDIVREMFNV